MRALRAIQHWANTAFDLALTLLFPKVSIVPFFSVWIVCFVVVVVVVVLAAMLTWGNYIIIYNDPSRFQPGTKKSFKKMDRCRPRSNCLTRLSSCSSQSTVKRNQTIEFLLSLLFRRANEASVSYPLKSTLRGVFVVALLPCRCASNLTIWNQHSVAYFLLLFYRADGRQI